MGKSNAKPQKVCGYAAQHPAHVWNRYSPATGIERSFWCAGVAQETKHVHVWEGSPIRTADGDLKDGVVECSCGMSKWLTDGRSEVRFPQADPITRLMALRDKVNAHGPDSLSEEDRAELNALAAALVAALKPLQDALRALGEQVEMAMTSFLDSIDSETMTELARLAQIIGEKPDTPETDTVDLVDSNGSVLDTLVIAHPPISATDLRSDEDQNRSFVDLSIIESGPGPADISVNFAHGFDSERARYHRSSRGLI